MLVVAQRLSMRGQGARRSVARIGHPGEHILEAKDAISASALSVVRYDPPIDWDGNEVRFAVGIAGLNNGHLEILGKIAVIFSDMDEVDKMIAAGSAGEVFDLLNAVNGD